MGYQGHCNHQVLVSLVMRGDDSNGPRRRLPADLSVSCWTVHHWVAADGHVEV